MNRLITLIMALLILITFVGCNSLQSKTDNNVTFYYRNVDIKHGAADGVIGSETRHAGEYRNDFEHLITIYLKGPRENDHTSPFPAGIYLKQFTLGSDRAYITLSSHMSLLSGLDLVIACACLTNTVLELTGVSSIEITAEDGTLDGNPYLIFNSKDFSYLDTYADTLN